MNTLLVDEIVKNALLEDIGYGDRTTEAIVITDESKTATMYAKQDGVIAGLPVVKRVFTLVDSNVQFTPQVNDGDFVQAGDVIGTLVGSIRSILTGERIALNFLQKMSGIATVTYRAVQSVRGTEVKITDTRKTTPGLRMFEKYAVKVGGGTNHRLRLDDAVMIKDNHIAAAGSISEAVKRVRENVGHMVVIEVETESLEQVKEAVDANVDVIMLDNMSPERIREALTVIPAHIVTEASGGVTLETLPSIAQTGVDVVSIGWLTHSAPALDISLNVDGSLKSDALQQ